MLTNLFSLDFLFPLIKKSEVHMHKRIRGITSAAFLKRYAAPNVFFSVQSQSHNTEVNGSSLKFNFVPKHEPPSLKDVETLQSFVSGHSKMFVITGNAMKM